jgi:hypothetical protein
MPIENIALFSTNTGEVDLRNFHPTVAVRLHLRGPRGGGLQNARHALAGDPVTAYTPEQGPTAARAASSRRHPLPF